MESMIDEKVVADIYNQLLELIGEENMLIVFQTFRGQQVAFPKRLYKTEYVIDEVRRRYDGTNLKALAKEFDYTDRHLRNLMFEDDKTNKRKGKC